MEEIDTLEQTNDGDEWRPFGIMDQFLPSSFPAFITTALWRQLGGPDEQHPQHDRFDAMCLQVTFALLGLVSADGERTPTGVSLLVPLPFASGPFSLRVTSQHWEDGFSALVLSLPEQRIP